MKSSQPGEDEARTAASRRQVLPTAGASFDLIVVDGPDTGVRFTVSASAPAPALLGQSATCSLQLTDREVSRRHAILDAEGQRLRITDQLSSNGTYIDGVAIVDGFASGGEVIRVGASALRVERHPHEGEQAVELRRGFGRFLGESTELQRLYPLIERLAASEVPLIIEGETGTGKEVLAESIHENSARRNHPYVVLDCTTITPNLAESELFGHCKGAFTGATDERRGVFEQAHGGTLFIDEIGDLEVPLQGKLLRAIERGEVRRVGQADQIRVDVRVIAATRRNLDQAVQDGLFRDDLFHRLAVGRIALPALRRRTGDILILARQFWSALAPDLPLPPDLLQRWESDPWPGNVRELKNAIARQVATRGLVDDASVQTASLGPIQTADEADGIVAAAGSRLQAILNAQLPFPVARLQAVEALQRAYVARALAAHDGNAENASKALGVSRRYFDILRTGKRPR